MVLYFITLLYFSNQPQVMEILLDNGANINAVNKGGCSALHVAVNKQHLDCVKVLLNYQCDVNIQDTYGDTAQHDAIGKYSGMIRTYVTSHSRCSQRCINYIVNINLGYGWQVVRSYFFILFFQVKRTKI